MVIDSVINIPAMQEPDIRIKKKNEAENPRPVEESEKGNHLELNFRRDGTEGNKAIERSEKAIAAEGSIYNSTGKLSSNPEMHRKTDDTTAGIDIVV
jgi:hypothetical protein